MTTINSNIFTQVNQDSGSLTAATTVVHRFAEPGEYRGILRYASKGSGVITEFTIVVGGAGRHRHHHHHDDDCGDHTESDSQVGTASQGGGGTDASGGGGGATQQQELTKVDIDLRALQMAGQGATTTSGTMTDEQDGCCDDCGDSSDGGGPFELGIGGYAVFSVPAGAGGGYVVEVYKAGGAGLGSKVFDNRELKESDILALILLRPGVYSMANSLNGAKAELTVGYPEASLGQMEPVKVACTKDAISPDKIKVRSTQGMVFSFETPSRIKVELVTPEDRPRPPRRRGSKGGDRGGSSSGKANAAGGSRPAGTSATSQDAKAAPPPGKPRNEAS
jgi:hypothetical protein